MPLSLKLPLNCLVVAALVYGGIILVSALRLPDLSPYGWDHGTFSDEERLVLGYVYRVLTWLVFGALVALLMLVLRPRRIFLYAFVSAATFAGTMRSWNVIAAGNIHDASLEIIWILTVPCLYWVFARIAQRKHEGSFSGVPQSRS